MAVAGGACLAQGARASGHVAVLGLEMQQGAFAGAGQGAV